MTMLSLDNHNKHERSSRNTTVINCEVYPDLEKEDNAKVKCANPDYFSVMFSYALANL